jgi:signal transduction histidine kinase/HAMP domain-containing protein
VPQRPNTHRKHKRQSISFEARLRIFCTVAALVFMGLVATVLTLLHVTAGPLFATLGILLLILLLVFAAFIEEAIRPIQTLANVVAALREEDYSFRARGANRDDSVGQLSLEINALADTLQAQRVGALEAVALLRRVIAEMDAPVLAFDQETRLRLLNPAAERVFALLPARDLGKTAEDLSLKGLLDEPSEAVLQLDLQRSPASGLKRPEPSQPARWMIRRGEFRQRGIPHTLVVLSDVSAALREEERLAWRRLIRVIGHEISNSLTPIKSIAGSLRSRMLPTAPRPDAPISSSPVSSSPASVVSPNGVLTRDLQRGLSVIENRAESLNRFVQAYRQLAQLPAPILKRVPLLPLLERVISLEIRLDVRLLTAPNVELLADEDQIEQLLINLVRNAVESALTCVEEEPGAGSAVPTEGTPGPNENHVILSEAKDLVVPSPATNLEEKENSVILSEAKDGVVPVPATSPAEQKRSVILSEAKDLVVPPPATNPAEQKHSVILSEASESVAPAPGRNKQFRRESNEPGLSESSQTTSRTAPAFPPETATNLTRSESSVILREASASSRPPLARQTVQTRAEGPGLSESSQTASRTAPAFSSSSSEDAKPCRPSVTIHATEDGDLVAIQIEDNGPGLANPENLFVPLYTTKKAGSGVGLALARQIVEAHGGAIELRNKPNHTGCIAEVRIPIAERPRG